MRKVKESTRYNVVSVRVSDKEKEQLCDLARKGKQSIGAMIRAELFGKHEATA